MRGILQKKLFVCVIIFFGGILFSALLYAVCKERKSKLCNEWGPQYFPCCLLQRKEAAHALDLDQDHNCNKAEAILVRAECVRCPWLLA